MNKKKVWVINQYITSPKMCDKTHRHFSLFKNLTVNNKITLFTGSYSHIHYNDTREVVSSEEGLTIVNLKILKYKSNLLRILNFFHFVLKLRFFNYKKLEQPDIIIISTMSLFPLLLIKFYKKKYKEVKIVHEIRDVWPLTPIMLGGYSEKNPFIKFLFFCEKIGYKNADHFVSNLRNAYKHIYKIVPERKHIPFTWVSNGYDNKDEPQKLCETLFNKLPKDKLLIGYAGSLGKANCMEVVVKAFNTLNDQPIHLCVIGDGDDKLSLEEMCEYENVTFFGNIPKNQVHSFLSKMDVCILSWKKTPLYDFGISPNKLFDYLNASKPVIMCGDIEDTIIEKSDCGWVIQAENIEALINKLNDILLMDSKELKEFGVRGGVYLKNNFLYEILAQKYQNEVLNVV